MPFSVPTTFSYPWAEVLSRHMAQLMNPSTGGLNVWDIRPTTGVDGQSLGLNHIGYTGFNTTSRVLERWNGSTWDILSGSGTMSASLPIWSTNTRPTSPSVGDFGYNTLTKQIERWGGSNWQPVASNDLEVWNTNTRPILAGEQAGKIGLNTTTRQIERWNGSTWENVTSPVVPPLSVWSTITRPSLTANDVGQFGYNSTTKQIERWNGSGWDNITPPLDSSSLLGGMPSWSTRPTTPTLNQFGYNTSTKKIERFDGSQWVDVSPRSDTPFGMGSWNTSSRPILTAADAGVFGFNTDTSRVERWSGSVWVPVTGLSDGTPLIPFWTTASRPNPTASLAGLTGFNTTTNRLETWNGSNWVPVAPDAALTSSGAQASSIPTWNNSTRPASPAPGTLGYNTSLPGVEVWNGTAWVPASLGNPPVGTTAPINPTTGQLWWDSGTGQLRAWNGTTWAPVVPTSTGGGSTSLPQWTTSTRPTNPSLGTMGYNTQTGNPEMWNGSQWLPLNNPPTDYRPTYQTWTDSTRPTGVAPGTVGFNSGTNQLEMWNGSNWQPISGGIPRLASRPFNPTEGYIYYNTGTDVVEYYNGTEWITLSRSGATGGGQGSSWQNPLQANSNITSQPNSYYLLDPANGPFEFNLPANPAVGTEVCIRGLNSALTNSVYINPNGKKFLGSTSRRVYSGTTPICITYIDETTGWSPSAAIPIEVVVIPPPADTGLFCWLRSNLGVFRNNQNRIHTWSADINSNPYELKHHHLIRQSLNFDSSDWSVASTDSELSQAPLFVPNALNGFPSVRTDYPGYPFPLSDIQIPSTPRKSTIFILGKAGSLTNPAYFINEGYYSTYHLSMANGFLFASFGMSRHHEVGGGGTSPSTLLYPISKIPPAGVFAIYVYQVDYDNNWASIHNNNGEVIAMGGFPTVTTTGTRQLFLGKPAASSEWPLGWPYSSTYNTAGSNEIIEFRWYNNLLTASQIRAVCDSLRTTYQVTHWVQ